MKRAITISILTLLVAAGMAGAALSQAPPAPSSAQTATPPEDASVTQAAKTLYAQLLLGKVDRSKMSAAVNAALSDSLLQTLSQQLVAAGTPKWQYLKQIQSPQGHVSVYRLTYPNATLYMIFGVSPGGTVFNLFFGSQEPAS